MKNSKQEIQLSLGQLTILPSNIGTRCHVAFWPSMANMTSPEVAAGQYLPAHWFREDWSHHCRDRTWIVFDCVHGRIPANLYYAHSMSVSQSWLYFTHLLWLIEHKHYEVPAF